MITLREGADPKTLEIRLSRSELILFKAAVEQAIIGGIGLYVPDQPDPQTYIKCIREP